MGYIQIVIPQTVPAAAIAIPTNRRNIRILILQRHAALVSPETTQVGKNQSDQVSKKPSHSDRFSGFPPQMLVPTTFHPLSH